MAIKEVFTNGKYFLQTVQIVVDIIHVLRDQHGIPGIVDVDVLNFLEQFVGMGVRGIRFLSENKGKDFTYAFSAV